MKDLLTKEYQYSHNIQDVWNAITKAEEISSWFIHADFKAEVGYQYTFTHDKTVIQGEVLEVDPVFNLVYTWIVRGTEATTKVKWHLEENDKGTLLNIEHSGISNYATEELATQMFEGFSQGWVNCIENLDKYLKNLKHAG